MWTDYKNADIYFTIADTRFHTLNFVYERFERSIPSHSHGNGSYEIHYIPQGRGRALINGVYHEVTPGALYVTGPHVEHAQIPLLEDPMCEYCIYLKTEKRRKSSSSFPAGEEELLSAFENTPFWFGQDTQKAGALMMEIFEELQSQRTGCIFRVEALLRQLLVGLVRNYEKSGRPKAASLSAAADKTAVIIEEYFLYQYRNLSLEDLADKLGLGTRQTERLLQRQYGKTFLQKKAEARMSAAAILLSDSSRSITSVAEDLGYSSIEHFSSAFKSYYHISPRQYRKEGVYHSFPDNSESGSRNRS
ncbi:MAG TPA: AraC family transcriptional regulator [Candidatus Eisenbergiella merdipullorum]|uniref:AraC family transcriptional regulator n=1 Tax=Candidatus Eisenbergiella merdipullorum TaxID=2838553 RepID=A0A9D2I520_9FIRM|nr:AraC family transcriptional regulator [Candidatus Eisenbergiella merdipullorum]